MKNIKEYSHFVLVLIAVLLLAACGGGGEYDPEKQDAATYSDKSLDELKKQFSDAYKRVDQTSDPSKGTDQLSGVYKRIYDQLEAKSYILYESGLGQVDGDFRGASGSIKVCENNYPKGFPEELKKGTTTTVFASYTGHEIKDILVNTDSPIYGYKGTNALESNTFERIYHKVSDMYNSQPVVNKPVDVLHGITGIIYTGSTVDGRVNRAANCLDWTSASSALRAQTGSGTGRTDNGRSLMITNQITCDNRDKAPVLCVMYSTK